MLSLVHKQCWDILSSDVLNSSAIYFAILDPKHACYLHQFTVEASVLAQEYKMGYGIELTKYWRKAKPPVYSNLKMKKRNNNNKSLNVQLTVGLSGWALILWSMYLPFHGPMVVLPKCFENCWKNFCLFSFF